MTRLKRDDKGEKTQEGRVKKQEGKGEKTVAFIICFSSFDLAHIRSIH
jgi:hypothetical protein